MDLTHFNLFGSTGGAGPNVLKATSDHLLYQRKIVLLDYFTEGDNYKVPLDDDDDDVDKVPIYIESLSYIQSTGATGPWPQRTDYLYTTTVRPPPPNTPSITGGPPLILYNSRPLSRMSVARSDDTAKKTLKLTTRSLTTFTCH